MIADHTPRTEVVECDSPNCSQQFERPMGVRGRPQKYCSRLCGNFARLMIAAAAQPQFRPFTYAPAPRRATPDNHTPDAHTAGGAVQSAHGHESLRRTPTESVTSATAPPTASTNNSQPMNTPKTGQGV